MNMRVWLRGLGLARYEKEFRKNKIDFDVLADLTEGDLEELGIPLGDRRRLLGEIAELSAQEPTKIRNRPATVTPARRNSSHSSTPPNAARSRSCSAILPVRPNLRPSLTLRTGVISSNAYLDEASKAVIAVGGHVLKRLGDGLMAVFGYPQAQENDAERAVRAALGIQQALGKLNSRNGATGAPRARRPHRPRRWSLSLLTTPAKCSAMRPTSPRAFRLLLSPEQCWSLRPSKGR